MGVFAGKRRIACVLAAAMALTVLMAMYVVAKPAFAYGVQADAQLTTAAQAADDKGAIEPGVYYIQSRLGALMLDVEGSSKANGANVQVWSPNKSAAQRWRIDKAKDGSYTITNVASGKRLDASSNSIGDSTNVLQWKSRNSAVQRWKIKNNGADYTISSAANSRYVLDVTGAYTYNGTNVQLYSANDTAAQKWWLLPAKPEITSKRTVANGIYELRLASSSSYVVELGDSAYANGSNVQLHKRNSSPAQRWRVKWESDGFYSLRNVSSGKVLEVANASPAVRANIQTWSSKGKDRQRWAIDKKKDGTITLTNKESGLALDVAGAKAANGTNVRTWLYKAGRTQCFKLVSVDPISEGTYVAYSLLAPESSAIGVAKSSKAGTQARLYSANDAITQRLQLRRIDDDVFAIQSAGSGLYFADVKGKVIQQKRSDGDEQCWRVALDGRGVAFVNVKTGRRLAVAGGKATNGAKLVTAKTNAGNAQRFRMVSTRLITDGYYEIHSAASSKRVLDVKGGSWSNGANVQVYKVNDTAAQAWWLGYVGDGYYQILNDGSAKALEVKGASKKNRANVRQNDYSKDDSQLWKPELREDGRLVFVNKASGMLLETAGTKNGSNVRQGEDSGKAVQSWKLVATDSRSLSGNAELDSWIRWVVDKNGGSLRSCFNWVTSNIRWTNSVSGEVLGNGYVGKQRTIDYALYAFKHYRGDCYYYAAVMKWLAIGCGYSAEVRAGHVPSASQGLAPHGWTEVYSGGSTYICDANLAVDIGGGYNWYMTTYAGAPVQYYL